MDFWIPRHDRRAAMKVDGILYSDVYSCMAAWWDTEAGTRSPTQRWSRLALSNSKQASNQTINQSNNTHQTSSPVLFRTASPGRASLAMRHEDGKFSSDRFLDGVRAPAMGAWRNRAAGGNPTRRRRAAYKAEDGVDGTRGASQSLNGNTSGRVRLYWNQKDQGCGSLARLRRLRRLR